MIADEHSLARLMASAQRGDRQAYATLLEQCQLWLRRYYARRVAPAALDDLVQETLLSLHRKRASYNPSRPFLPWLAAIARYRWVDHLRKIYRRDEVELPEQVAADPQGESINARISINRLMTLLPSGQSEAIQLVKIEGLSIDEASRRSGQSQSLIKVNIHRGLKKLASLIERT